MKLHQLFKDLENTPIGNIEIKEVTLDPTKWYISPTYFPGKICYGVIDYIQDDVFVFKIFRRGFAGVIAVNTVELTESVINSHFTCNNVPEEDMEKQILNYLIMNNKALGLIVKL